MVQAVSEKISEMDAVATLSRAAVFPVTDGAASYKVPLSRISRVFNVLNYGAVGNGTTLASVEAAAFALADAAAALVGGTVYVPAGTYGNGTSWSYAMSSGVTLEGDGDSTVLVNCYLSCSGSVGNEIAFTAPATKGATSISIPATGLSGSWIHVSSCINANSSDAGVEQLGDRNADFSYLGEFKRILTGSVGSATLHGRTLYPYSNTPGGDSGSATTSVARVVTWHENGSIRSLKLRGVNSSQSCAFYGVWCRNLLIEDVTVDTNNTASKSALQLEYCMDSKLRRGRYIGRDSASAAAAADNVIILRSCQRTVCEFVDIVGGYQGGDITYVAGSTYRGGPSIDCGFRSSTSVATKLDGFTDHPGCHRSIFESLTVTDADNGIRIRSRGTRVKDCQCTSGAGSGVLIQEGALFDSDVGGNHCDGYVFGIEFTGSHATGYDALRAALGGSIAKIHDNTVLNSSDTGIALVASSALATFVGPRVYANDVHSPGGHGVSVGSYLNGTVLDENRAYGIPSGKRGVTWGANIKRLRVGTSHVFNVHASGFAMGGPSVASFMTDATTFPGGEAEALLYLGDLFTDAATAFTGILRDSTAYIQAMWAGNGGGTYRAARVFVGTGTPEGNVYAGVGSAFLRTDSATTLYIKQTGTGNTGWVAK